jgi:three-Cys-motif partner protein
MAASAKLSWGFWSESKLTLLEDYLAGFLTACKQPSVAVYLDVFAGEGTGLSRSTGEEFNGSARIAAAAAANGFELRFSALRFIELSAKRARQIETELSVDFPGRDIKVIPGDCNQEIHKLLASIPRHLTRAPTFAFLDPFGVELRWDTIRVISDFKRGLRNKVELFMLLQTPGIMRIAGLSEDRAVIHYEQTLTDLFGCCDWEPIVQARRDGVISGRNAREAFANLMRWRLKHDLDYEHTHILEFFNSQGTPVYHMIFVTDNAAGNKIMRELYDKAARRNQTMRDELKARRGGTPTLFPTGDILPDYSPEPPIAPAIYLSALVADEAG